MGTFLLQELDDATQDYLLGVKKYEGRGYPGVYVPVSNSLPTVGCCLGVLLIGIMLPVTLYSDIILGDPTGVALLQTAVLLLGGWMIVAALRVRAGKASRRVAGYWVYADPLHLYEAKNDQVKVTPIDEAVEAQFTHNYNNGSYQNTVVRVLLPGKTVHSVTVNDERRAERLVVFVNYLSWARGPEGGERGNLEPATLGGLAKYVAQHENEPLDAEGNVNLDLIELRVNEVPEEPRREGRAVPNFLAYVVMLIAGLGCFFLMREANVPRRDDKIFEAVTKTPPPLEPRVLRAYLVDKRNTRHKKEIEDRLAEFYTRTPDGPIAHVTQYGADPTLRAGFADVLRSVSREPQPVVSIRVKETKAPAGVGDADERVKTVRTGFVDRTAAVFSAQPWGQPISHPEFVFNPPPPPIGEQLLAFVEAPEDAKTAHFVVEYGFEPTAPGADEYRVKATVEIRDKVPEKEDDTVPDPVAKKTITLPYYYSVKKAGALRAGVKAGAKDARLRAVDKVAEDLKDRFVADMIGEPNKAPNAQPFEGPNPGQFKIPGDFVPGFKD
jgi:hypothetical protein